MPFYSSAASFVTERAAFIEAKNFPACQEAADGKGVSLFVQAAECSLYEAKKQGVRSVGAAFKFRMKLHTHIKRVLRQLHGFHNVPIGRGAADNKAVFLHKPAVVVIKLVAVAVTLADKLLLVTAVQNGSRGDFAGIGTQTHCAALVHAVVLVGHKVYDPVSRGAAKFA